MLHPLGQLADVDQPILMDPDVHKCPEVDDVAHRPLELHPGLQVPGLHHIGAQDGGGQLVPGVPAGLHQLLDDVRQGGDAHAAHPGQRLQAHGLRLLLQGSHGPCPDVGQGVAALGQQRLRGGVALRMDTGVVQNGGALRHPQEAGALLKGLGAQLGHLQDLPAGGEGPVLLPVFHQVFGSGGGEAGHPLEQGGGGGVHIHAHRVDAVLHHPVQGLAQPGLGHVVLVLAHADGLRVDLHQLSQRVLEPPGDGHGGAQVHIVLGELLGGQLGGGVDRGPGLADDHIAQAAPQSVDQLHRHLLGLPAGGAVADGDVLHAVLSHQMGQLGDGLLFLPLPIGGVDYRRVQHLAGAVHHRHLAAHAVAGIQSHGDLALHRRLHQQGLQVQGKLADGALAGLFRQCRPHFPFQRGVNEAVIGVLCGVFHKFHGRGAGLHYGPPQQRQRQLPIQQDGGAEFFLLLPPVDGKDLMALQSAEGLLKLVVQAVNAVLLRSGEGTQGSPPLQQLPQALADGRIIADPLGDDVVGSLQGVGNGFHALFRVDEALGGFLWPGAVPLLCEQQGRQRFQPLLLCRGGAGAAFLLIGAVKVLHLCQRFGAVNGGGQLCRQLSLLLNGIFYRLPALLQPPEVLETLFQRAERRVVHGAVKLLTVTGNKGNGIALVQQANHVFHILRFFVKLLGKSLNDIHSLSFRSGNLK